MHFYWVIIERPCFYPFSPRHVFSWCAGKMLRFDYSPKFLCCRKNICIFMDFSRAWDGSSTSFHENIALKITSLSNKGRNHCLVFCRRWIGLIRRISILQRIKLIRLSVYTQYSFAESNMQKKTYGWKRKTTHKNKTTKKTKQKKNKKKKKQKNKTKTIFIFNSHNIIDSNENIRILEVI